MNYTTIIKNINEDMTSCQTSLKKIAELLDNFDSAQCTDENFPPLFIVMLDEYIKLQEETHTIQNLLKQIQCHVNQLKEG